MSRKNLGARGGKNVRKQRRPEHSPVLEQLQREERGRWGTVYKAQHLRGGAEGPGMTEEEEEAVVQAWAGGGWGQGRCCSTETLFPGDPDWALLQISSMQ